MLREINIMRVLRNGVACLCLCVIFNTFLKVNAVDNSVLWSKRQIIAPDKIPESALHPNRQSIRRKILLYHNFFRTKVKPTASNMVLMSWHQGAANMAQAYAEKCKFLKHNSAKENVVPTLGVCGQNLFVAAQKTPWFFGIKSWFVEYQNFTYGIPVKDFKSIGHYTQMVWATSSKVGCGVARCTGGPWGHFYNYVCHYCPAGNYDDQISFPYKAGKPCGDCKDHCVGGGLCTNVCNFVNKYKNCDELVAISRSDICRKDVCDASCLCGNTKIYKNFPWL